MTVMNHLDRLESEAIHIIREVVAEFDKPVMLYSIGKDSAVMFALGYESVCTGSLAISIAPRRYDLEVS